MPAKRLTKKMIEARINRAVTGFQIPMMSIPKMYRHLEHAIRSELSDDQLKAIVAGYPGVVVSN